jgi:hypothetical protein
LILIDEPELNLHPALQLDFLNTLGSFASHGVLFATHSVGLARAASDAVYSVRRAAQGVSELRPFEATPAMTEFLGELSLSGYQELGYSTVLLVEGPTELRTVQGLLRHYRLEHKVVLLPLGGGSMIRPGVAEPLREIRRLVFGVRTDRQRTRIRRRLRSTVTVPGLRRLAVTTREDCSDPVLARRSIRLRAPYMHPLTRHQRAPCVAALNIDTGVS